jgi:hypothetical protein
MLRVKFEDMLVMLRVNFKDTLLAPLGLEEGRCDVKRMLIDGL